MSRRPRLRSRTTGTTAAGLAIVTATLLGGCSVNETPAATAQPAAGRTREQTGDQTTNQATAALVCAKAAKAVSVPASFPAQAAVPEGYVVTDVQARTAGRTVVTAVSPRPFKQTLADMQRAYSTRGWTAAEGEVEARDAESDFAGNGLRGRWAIREIPACTDNTSVSVLIGK